MKDKEDRWDEYIEGALFAINTNQSTTTKYSPFYLLFGRNPRFPFEAEKSEITPSGSDDIAQLMQDLSNEVIIREYIEETSRMKDTLFPLVESNIQKAQEKQKEQYQKKKGQPVCQFKAGDAVLLRNMLQKTKKGHKLEDLWLGPYEISEIKADKGVCKLLNPSTKKEMKQQSIKNLRLYKQENTAEEHQEPTLSAEEPQEPTMSAEEPQEPTLDVEGPQQPTLDAEGPQQPTLDAEEPQQPNLDAEEPSQVSLSEAKTSETKRSGTKYSKEYESSTKTTEGIKSHKTQSDGKPPDIVQLKTNQSKAKQSDASHSRAKPLSSTDVDDNKVELPKKENPLEKLFVNEISVIDSVDKHPAAALSSRACEDIDGKIQNMEEQDILSQLSSIKTEVHNKFKSNKKCWRHDVFSSGNSKEAPGIKRKDLSVNVHFGGFNEDQLQFILNELKKWFPAVGVDFLTTVVLPEALIILCKAIFEITYDEAEYYLAHGGKCFVQETLDSLKKRAPKRKKTIKRKMPAKKSKPDPTHFKEDECVYVKETKSNSMSKMRKPNYQVQVTKEDEDIMMNNLWLTDVQIGKAQNLLKQQFPNVQGLQPTTLGPHQQFDIMRGEFVQILHTGAKHWICISNIYCNKENTIKIYDSMYLEINTFTKKQIAGILHIESSDAIEIMVEPVTQQVNGFDCGVFAIAFAAALCYGQDPSKVDFQKCNIRNFLWNCFTNGHIDMFPFVPRNYVDQQQPRKKFLLPIYCKCRLPYVKQEDDMVMCSSCKKWCHKKCLEVSNTNWKCSPQCAVKN